jgi:hypothetical protein
MCWAPKCGATLRQEDEILIAQAASDDLYGSGAS